MAAAVVTDAAALAATVTSSRYGKRGVDAVYAWLERCAVRPVVTLTQEEREACVRFGRACAPTNNYGVERGQHDVGRCAQQAAVGKAGELAVWRHLASPAYARPDFAIYAAAQKSFDADLTRTLKASGGGGGDVHVKTQEWSMADRFGASWTFQYADRHGKRTSGNWDRRVFGDDAATCADLCTFCLFLGDVYATTWRVMIVGSWRLRDLRAASSVFGYPIKLDLRPAKRVVYLERLMDADAPDVLPSCDDSDASIVPYNADDAKAYDGTVKNRYADDRQDKKRKASACPL